LIETGSGAGGRIVMADVLAAASIETRTSAESTPAAASALEVTKATVPHFQVQTEVRIDRAIALRAQLKGIVGDEPAPSLNDLIVRAAALALRSHPRANGSYRDGTFELHDRINVGIAVAAADALVVPTIFDADRKSLGTIGRESRRLAERVRAGGATPPDLAGGTFTVSNLGLFGMTAIHPVINPPQAAILGVGRARPVLRRGAVSGRPITAPREAEPRGGPDRGEEFGGDRLPTPARRRCRFASRPARRPTARRRRATAAR
jgi:pyruvate dehydrogenase E2 component (dihydrolipoamide acetyltransferase)